MYLVTPRLSLLDCRLGPRASFVGCAIACSQPAALSSKRTWRPPTVGEGDGLTCLSSSLLLSLSESEMEAVLGGSSSGGTVGYRGLYLLLSFSNSFACFSTRSLQRVYLSVARARFLRCSGLLSHLSLNSGDSSRGSPGTLLSALASYGAMTSSSKFLQQS